MKPEQIEAIRIRAEKVTECPWQTTYPSNYIVNSYGIGVDNFDDDSEFLAHAREDIPSLLAEVERLKTALEFAESQLKYEKSRNETLESALQHYRGYA